MPQQGKALTIEQKQMIVTLKHFFDKENQDSGSMYTTDSVGRVAECLQIGRRTIEQILSDYNKNGHQIVETRKKSPGRPPYIENTSLVSCIRQHIRSMNRQRQYLSVRNLGSWLAQEHRVNIPRTTLWRALRRFGFIHGEGKRRSSLKERAYVVIARRKYLRRKRANRNPGGTLKKPEVYLGETYINRNHSNDNTWYFEESGPWINKPSGKGPRLVIVHAITNAGWVNGAQLVFQAKKRSGDYHEQMNWEVFSSWFVEQLIPNISPNSFIILDNAAYHNVFVDDAFPTPRSKKHELQNWLIQNNHRWEKDMLKPELFELCKQLAPLPEFKLDLLAKQYGHTILRTPPYHPELQPIETCWGIVKNYCRDHCKFTMENLYEELPIGFSKVTADTCDSFIEKVRLEEDRFWMEDSEMYDNEDQLWDENNEFEYLNF